ncbi:VanW family protein [Nonomuraea glycinis]|uniref:Vanomycin resistance protein VanB n=1 Tax=Nonomuraea glycinis TaxID=2047744 RepID=A0A918A018_9ACTN|nr:VanW family protein [Nonomuraea glycinis]MCA2175156.1 VanW family protein [Nonomuraea glycinis]GGP00714.1 vanomycin resistance protein VanB [Nonomuraea glycinis]
MRNAGPIESPTDPFSSVPLPSRATSKKPKIEGLPPGVSRDIFGAPGQQQQEPRRPAGATPPAQSAPNGGALPPATPPSQPWPVNGNPQETPSFGRERPAPALIEPDPPRRRRLLPAITVLLLIAVAMAYLVPAVLMSGSVLRGTRVGGVDIGGLTVTQAAEKLRTELAAKLNKPVVVDIGTSKDTIQPDEAGLQLDVVTTIGEAPSGFPTPFEVWRALTGTTEIEPRVTVDASQLARTVDALAETVDKPPHDGRVTFKGLQPVATPPRDGALIDRAKAVHLISEAFLRGSGSAVLSLEPAQPTTTPEAITKAEAQAKRAVAAPITLTLGDRQAQLTPQTIAANLTFGSDGEGSLAPQFDAKTALTGVESSLVDAAQVPRDATYDVVNGKLVLVPARQGRGVNSKLLARDLAKLVRNGGPRVIPVRLAAAPPQVTTEQVTGLGIKENVASFTSTFECCLPRVTNVRQMAADIDGRLVLPGQTFSLNDVVGERTAEGGYVLAPQTVGGRVITVMGGGASQLATTLYNAAFFGGFDDVAHTPMDYHSNRYPAGRDAALLYPGVDLKWRNDSEHGVLIKTASTATSVTVALWSTKRYDKIEAVESAKRDFTPFRVETGAAAGCRPVIGQQGFTMDVTRVFFKGGDELKRDPKVTTKYRPHTQVTCTGTG